MNIFFSASSIALQVFSLFFSFVIYKTLVSAFGIGGWVVFVVLMTFSLSFFATSILAARYKHQLVRWFHLLGMYWIAFVLPLFCACIAFVLIKDIAPVFGWTVTSLTAGRISFTGAVFLYIYGVWKSTEIKIARVTVAISHCPAFWRNKTIAFVSDVHLGNEYGARLAARIVRKISSLAPQAVFIGGDLFDGVKCRPDDLLFPFRKLRTPHGVYFVSGNHEHILDNKLFLGAIRRAGITILNNKKKTIEGMDFLGVDFRDSHKKKNFEKVLSEMAIDPKRPNVLIKHIPDNLQVAERAGIALQVSGHTHQGQIFPLTYLTKKIYKGYDYGLKQFGNMAVYTSSGVSAAPIPVRFGTNSEIVLIEFKNPE